MSCIISLQFWFNNKTLKRKKIPFFKLKYRRQNNFVLFFFKPHFNQAIRTKSIVILVLSKSK